MNDELPKPSKSLLQSAIAFGIQMKSQMSGILSVCP